MVPDPDITRLIAQWQNGDQSAENALFQAVYDRLHAMAVQCLRSERPGNTIGATALVHEAYLRFKRAEQLEITGRSHFLALAARVMRRILVDRARSRQAQKRVLDPVLDAPGNLIASDAEAVQILAVDRALAELSKKSTRLAQLVELRYFAGYTVEESAQVLGLSTRQTRRDWQTARVRLRLAIEGGSEAVSDVQQE